MVAPAVANKVHRYTLEFKIQAVKLSLHPEIQTQDVAQSGQYRSRRQHIAFSPRLMMRREHGMRGGISGPGEKQIP